MAVDRQSAKGKLVEKYLTDNPEMPSLTMAKIIFRDHPLEFTNVEAVRQIIRRYRGVCGEQNRKDNHRGGKYYKNKDAPINFAPYAMPKPIGEDIQPYILPLACNNIGWLSDLHIPQHREEPINLACKYFLEQNINTLVLGGDILDNTPFTRHDGKRPSASEVREWFDQTEFFLEWLRDLFPTATIIWLEGNHDFWYRRWMQAHAWQIDDDPYYSIQERLHIDEYKIKFIPQEQYIMAGKLAMCHGHMLMGKFGSGVSPARSVYLKTKRSVIIGHVHRTDEYTETDLQGEITTCWSTGAMCTLTPAYQPMAGKANFGFAHITVNKDGSFNVENKRIFKGKIL